MRTKQIPRTSELGQVLLATLIWILVLMAVLMVTHAIGQSVNRRVAAQALADAGAYTGASAMGVGFNALARINRAIRDEWPLAIAATTSGIECSTSWQMLGTYVARVNSLASTYRTLNRRWRRRPFLEAQRVTNFNLYDLFPGERGFDMQETDPAMGLAALRDRRVLLESTQTSEPREWTCTLDVPPYELYQSEDLPAHFRRTDLRVRAFSWVVKTPDAVPQIGGGLFALPVLPAMKAAAVAKPVGGNLEAGDAAYVVKLLPFAEVGVDHVAEKGGKRVRSIRH